MPKLTTTLNRIREHRPCKSGWEKLLRHLDKTAADDEIIDLLTVLESNGVQDTLWCMRATIEDSRTICVELACRFAENVLPVFEQQHPADKRPRLAIQAARDYIAGRIDRAAYAAADAASAADAAYAVFSPQAEIIKEVLNHAIQ